jgi:acyl-CoA synthetase (AMP-forming)/AMP-acid ligase II
MRRAAGPLHLTRCAHWPAAQVPLALNNARKTARLSALRRENPAAGFYRAADDGNHETITLWVTNEVRDVIAGPGRAGRAGHPRPGRGTVQSPGRGAGTRERGTLVSTGRESGCHNRTAPEDDIIGFARDNLAHFKAPRGVTFVSDLPKTATGKIQKYVLRKGAPNLAAQ